MGAVTEETNPRTDVKRVRVAPLHLRDQRVPMRDGVALSADVYLPVGGVEGGPYPAILVLTPYNNQHATYRKTAVVYARHGYATVIPDCRGRLDSGEEFHPCLKKGPEGYDTVEWLSAQPWCTGTIGMIGGSYDGTTRRDRRLSQGDSSMIGRRLALNRCAGGEARS